MKIYRPHRPQLLQPIVNQTSRPEEKRAQNQRRTTSAKAGLHHLPKLLPSESKRRTSWGQGACSQASSPEPCPASRNMRGSAASSTILVGVLSLFLATRARGLSAFWPVKTTDFTNGGYDCKTNRRNVSGRSALLSVSLCRFGESRRWYPRRYTAVRPGDLLLTGRRCRLRIMRGRSVFFVYQYYYSC